MDIIVVPTKQNVIMDATVMTALMACPEYFDLRFNKNLVPISGTANPLEVGQMVHKILEVFNQCLISGEHRNTAVIIGLEAGQQFYRTAENIPEENEYQGSDKILQDGTKSKAKGKLKQVGYNWIMTTMQQYFDRWKNDSWTPIESEKVRGAVLYEDEEIRVLWKAKIDKVVDTFQDGIMAGDYKTMKMNRDPLLLNNQFMGQCLVTKSRKMFIDKIGFQTTLEPKDKFIRQIMGYTAGQLARQIQVIGYYAKYMISLKEGGYYPPNYTHCDKYNGCMYRKLQECDPNDKDRFVKLHFKIGEEWDPSNPDDADED